MSVEEDLSEEVTTSHLWLLIAFEMQSVQTET